MQLTMYKLRQRLAKHRLKALDFSIISNNCWGTHIYQLLGRQFNTPFVGLFISPESYLRLLSQFPRCLSLPLKFKAASDEAWINQARAAHFFPWPIGSLRPGIEIQFMHYKSEGEASDKWKRRTARLVSQPERLFFKFCDRDGCTPGHLASFEQLPFLNKVFFTTRPASPARHAVTIPSLECCVPDGGVLARLSPTYFDSVDWLGGGSGHVHWWGKMLNCI